MRIIVLENIAKYIANAKLLDRFFSSYKDGAIFSDNDWTSIWDAIKDNVKNDISTYYAKENAIDPELLEWINDNMNGYSMKECLLATTDMKKISKILSECKLEKSFTSMYNLTVTSPANPQMKRSVSLDDVRSSSMGTFRPRSNTM